MWSTFETAGIEPDLGTYFFFVTMTFLSLYLSQPIRYSSAKRPRSKEDRTAFVVGVPVYTLERMDNRTKKVHYKTPVYNNVLESP